MAITITRKGYAWTKQKPSHTSEIVSKTSDFLNKFREHEKQSA
jgi:hypothetical protein